MTLYYTEEDQKMSWEEAVCNMKSNLSYSKETVRYVPLCVWFSQKISFYFRNNSWTMAHECRPLEILPTAHRKTIPSALENNNVLPGESTWQQLKTCWVSLSGSQRSVWVHIKAYVCWDRAHKQTLGSSSWDKRHVIPRSPSQSHLGFTTHRKDVTEEDGSWKECLQFILLDVNKPEICLTI